MKKKIRVINIKTGETKEVPECIANNKILLESYGFKIEDLNYHSIINDNHQPPIIKNDSELFEQEENLQEGQIIKNKRGRKPKTQL